MGGIVFSLPVHERPDIVRDQLENIQFFCPNATVCVHVSSSAASDIDAFRKACDLPNVILNPHSLETIWGKGILHCHISNFECASSQGVDFEKFVLISSNELFVKSGASEHILQAELGAQTEVFYWATDWHLFKQEMLDDPRTKQLLNTLGLPLFFGGQAEGQFFTKGAFAFISRIYTEIYPMAPCGFVSEEMIPPTVAAYLCMTGKSAALPITLCDYGITVKFDEEFVSQIISGRGAIYARRIPRALRSPHIGSSVLKDVYSVKRIPREDCELRRFIRGLQTKEDT